MQRPDDPRALPRIALAQAGVFTAQQALREGWSARQVRRRLDNGRWCVVAGRGLASSAHPAGGAAADTSTGWGDGTRAASVALAWAAQVTWPDAVICGPTAASIHGLPVPPAYCAHVATPAGRRALKHLLVHVNPLQPGELHRYPGGLVITTRFRSAVDCLATSSFDDCLDLWAWLSSRQVMTRGALAQAVRQRLGCHGTPQLLRLLSVTRSGAVSAAEHRIHVLLRARGVTGWRANVRVWDGDGLIGRVDLLFEGSRVVVEIDGYRAHRGRAAFIADRRRQNRLVAAGYIVLRYTWDDLLHRPDCVIAEIAAATAQS